MKALLSIPIVAALTCGTLSAGAAEPLKQQLVGTWSVISFVNKNERTGKTTEVFGPDPKGYFMFDAADHFSINLMRPGRPKFARRDFPTAGESKTTLEGNVFLSCLVQLRVLLEPTNDGDGQGHGGQYEQSPVGRRHRGQTGEDDPGPTAGSRRPG